MAKLKFNTVALKQSFIELNQKFSKYNNLVLSRLKNFKTITIQEKVAYSLIVVGISLILISFVLFLF